MPAGRPLEPAGDGRPRWMTAGRDAARRPVHRIRLTGQLVRPTLHRLCLRRKALEVGQQERSWYSRSAVWVADDWPRGGVCGVFYLLPAPLTEAIFQPPTCNGRNHIRTSGATLRFDTTLSRTRRVMISAKSEPAELSLRIV
jgi:hypothetical protein